MKIALVYDRVNKWGGAERVLLALHALYPEAPLFTSVYHPPGAPWADHFDIRPSFLNRLPLASRNHEALVMAMPIAFESFDLKEFDVVISVTSAEAKGVITAPSQLHLCYLLTPTRYLWSHTQEYAGEGLDGGVRQAFMSRLRQWDFLAAQRPDAYVTISNTVASRTRKYYRRPVHSVIYPPVNTIFFGTPRSNCRVKVKDYYLLVSRLVGYKTIMPVIEAFNLNRLPLVIIGSGRQESALRSKASANIHFLGSVDDTTLACYYQNALGLIFPQEEDFGITAVEAQAAGKPVIAFGKGAAKETVIEGKTGLFFHQQNPKSIMQAVADSRNHTWYDNTIRLHASRFSQEKFSQAFTSTLEELWHRHQQAKK